MARRFALGIDVMLQKVLNVASPTNPTDGVNKAYVDALVQGLTWKDEVRAASTTNGTLATAYAAGQVLDGYTLVLGDRFLLKDQTTGSENGIWIVTNGTPTRATDADTVSELNNATVKVTNGSTNKNATFTQTVADPTPGTTAQVWVASGGSGLTQGNGISIVSNVISALVAAGGGLLVGASGLSIDPTSQYARKAPYATNLPAGNATPTITHNLNTTDVGVFVYDVSVANAFVLIDVDVTVTGVNTLTLGFGTAPTTGQYRVIVFP
jgi:hypothetical protein